MDITYRTRIPHFVVSDSMVGHMMWICLRVFEALLAAE